MSRPRWTLREGAGRAAAGSAVALGLAALAFGAAAAGWLDATGFGLPASPLGWGLALAAAPLGLGLVWVDVALTAWLSERERRPSPLPAGRVPDWVVPPVTQPAPAAVGTLAADSAPALRLLEASDLADLPQDRLAAARPWMAGLFVAGVVAAEETVRAAALALLEPATVLGIAGAVVLVNVCYGLFHASYGRWAVPAKVLDGLAYTALLLASGSVLVPALAHAAFDLYIRRLLRLKSGG